MAAAAPGGSTTDLQEGRGEEAMSQSGSGDHKHKNKRENEIMQESPGRRRRKTPRNGRASERASEGGRGGGKEGGREE